MTSTRIASILLGIAAMCSVAYSSAEGWSTCAWLVSQYGLEQVREFFRAGAHPDVPRATWSLWRTFFNEKGEQWPSESNSQEISVAPWIG